MGNATSSETLALMKQALSKPMTGGLSKAYTQSGSATSGLTYYSLEPSAKLVFPTLTPLRNNIPRVTAGGGIQANWRAITGVNTANAGIGVSQGNRGVVTTTSTADYSAAYKGYGLDDYVTFEADWAAEGFENIKALASSNLLRALMIGEEKWILGGNCSTALGITPTPTTSDVGTGGSLAANTSYNVYCVALTLDGYLASSVTAGLPLSGTRTLADGTTEAYNCGTGKKSLVATQATANDGNSTHCIKASVAAVNGAIGYAWFWGTAGNEVIGAITTINSILITAAAAGSQNISVGFGSDYSQNSLAFDGLLTQALKSGSGAYVNTLATGTAGTGSTLTADNQGGIVELDAALLDRWNNYRLSPDCIWVSSQEQANISKKILSASSNAAQRFSFNVDQGMLAGGVMVRSYLNKYSLDGAKEIPIKLHPNLPPGTILMTTGELPYPLSNVGNVMQMSMRHDYYQIAYPLRTRKYEYGVYADGVLQHYFPPAMAVITNIANG